MSSVDDLLFQDDEDTGDDNSAMAFAIPMPPPSSLPISMPSIPSIPSIPTMVPPMPTMQAGVDRKMLLFSLLKQRLTPEKYAQLQAQISQTRVRDIYMTRLSGLVKSKCLIHFMSPFPS